MSPAGHRFTDKDKCHTYESGLARDRGGSPTGQDFADRGLANQVLPIRT